MIGMSGGVDSSVAAALLVQKGYNVVGVTMKLWDDDKQVSDSMCCSLDAVNDAKRVADMIGIPHYVLNLKDEFQTHVINYFMDEYALGHTPNPCIACNKKIKFDLFLKKANAMGIDYIATGHYAKAEYNEKIKRWILKKSKEKSKDQTYVLYGLTQEQLEHTLFPLSEFDSKEEVRKIAEKLGLRVANKPESQEICFVEGNYGDFIESKRPGISKSGDFVDVTGRVLGRHKGLIHYTIGQRKGLGIALGKPMFVTAIDTEKNQVILGDESRIFSDELIAADINLIAVDKIEKEMEVKAKVRYLAKESCACISPLENGQIKVKFEEKQRAITPGQAVVFYKDDVVIGGGTII
ncbi:MAG: tRNA 2-thiouridine(34) synthase MnmA [Ignavibacteriales bacterium]